MQANVDYFINNRCIFLKFTFFQTPVNTKTREHGSQSSRKLKMAPLWLPYILSEQNSIDITTNDVKSFRNPIRTKTVYIQHCAGTQMAWHT